MVSLTEADTLNHHTTEPKMDAIEMKARASTTTGAAAATTAATMAESIADEHESEKAKSNEDKKNE